jgi:hypothetical protein
LILACYLIIDAAEAVEEIEKLGSMSVRYLIDVSVHSVGRLASQDLLGDQYVVYSFAQLNCVQFFPR